MIAFKAFDFELMDRYGNKYEFEKWYEDNKIGYIPVHGEHGFHCCLNPWDTIVYFKNVRIVKVELKDYVIKERNGDRVGSIVIAKQMKLLQDYSLALKNFAVSDINWLYVSNYCNLTDEQLLLYKDYIHFKRYCSRHIHSLYKTMEI